MIKRFATAALIAAVLGTAGPALAADKPAPGKPAASPSAQAQKPAAKKPDAKKPEAKKPPKPGMVWTNADSKVYHKEGSRFYGTTAKGEWMTEADAKAKGYRLAGSAPDAKKPDAKKPAAKTSAKPTAKPSK